MDIQTLVVTTGQDDLSLLEKMAIQTDAIVGNQCDRDEILRCRYGKGELLWLSLKERGVGLNRNTVFMRASADICVFADDDMVFHAGYPAVVRELFGKYPEADVILFDLEEAHPRRKKITKVTKVGRSNYGRYGAARLALRRERVQMAGVSFHLLFGGGAKYGSGEDSIFLHDCIKKGLKVLAVPVAIATLHDDRPSTWFRGYGEKFYFDKGVLYAQIYGWRAPMIALYNCLRHGKGRYKEWGWKRAYGKMREGIRSVRGRRM